ncbi:MAG TPA: hypothetical protein VG501_04170 [Rhizomicrobium sp.]|nr:hypothetical protein [Rhizomicrobium sp.]
MMLDAGKPGENARRYFEKAISAVEHADCTDNGSAKAEWVRLALEYRRLAHAARRQVRFQES